MPKNVHPDDMPQDVHLIQLYQDVLLDLFTHRIETSDEYLDEVLPSGWSIAPEIPDKFKKFLSGTPYTKEFDKDKSSGAQLREEVQDWSDGRQEIAKAIQEEFGVDNDTFTITDVVDLKSSFKKGSVRPYFSDTYSEQGYATKTGEKDGQADLWRWVKSIYAEDAIADGGIPHDFRNYHWQDAKELDPDTAVQASGLNPRDWFADKNLDEFLQLYQYAAEINQRMDSLQRKREDIEMGWRLDEWDVEEVHEALDHMKNRFQDLFSILTGLCITALDNVSACAGAQLTQDKIDGVHEKYKPHKKQKIQRTRLDSKRWAIIRTYIDPILNYYPEDVAQRKTDELAARLADLEHVVHAFLRWLWVCYQDLEAKARWDGEDRETVTERILRSHKGKGGSGEIGFERLRKQVNTEFDIKLNKDQFFKHLYEIGEQNDYSIRVWEAGEEPDDSDMHPSDAPGIDELTVEIFYGEEYDPKFIKYLRRNAHGIPT